MSIICEILIDFFFKIFKCFIPERDESAIIFVYKDEETIKDKEIIETTRYEGNSNDNYYSCYETLK